MSVQNDASLKAENALLRQQLAELRQKLTEQDRREQRLQVALHASPVVVFYQDRDLRYTWAFNPHPAFTPEGIVGKTDFELLPRQTAERLTAVKRQAQQSGTTIRTEVELVIDGETYPYDMTLTPLGEDDQPAGGIIGVACDVRQRRQIEDQLRAAEHRNRSLIDQLELSVADRTKELAQSARQLEEQSGMLRSILDSMSDGVSVADTEGRFILFNPAGERIIGLGATDSLPDDWANRYGLFLPDGSGLYPAEELPLVRAMRGEVVRNLEVLVRKPGAADVLLNVNASPLRDGEGRLLGGVAVYRDTTAPKLAQHALADSEERFRQLAESINEVFWLGGVGEQQGVNLYVSPAYATIFGRALDSLRQNPASWFEAVHPDDRERVRLALAKEESGLYDAEFRIIRPDGEVRWIHDRAFPVRDATGQICRIAGIAEDITQRKKFEQQLASDELLLRRLLDLQEKERQLTASEIHDGFVQYVVGAHMRLEASLDRLSASEQHARQWLEAASVLMQQAIREARRMIVDLRPMILDERGIVSAIEHLVSDGRFCENLEVDFIHDLPAMRLDPMLEGTLFRIVQEALNNVRAHSGSPCAAVRLQQLDGNLHLEIQDWGIGFDPQAVSPHRFGIQGIQQRARLFGGIANIVTRHGQGTVVEVRLPVKFQEHDLQVQP
ncbi:MAG: PAS domain S-box protein [Planctomycetes bacterium]|nr:PAS domain S-box protein [Planctomycetota bacterium]